MNEQYLALSQIYQVFLTMAAEGAQYKIPVNYFVCYRTQLDTLIFQSQVFQINISVIFSVTRDYKTNHFWAAIHFIHT